MALKVKAAPVMAAPNVIPMADIMLVLLIIFMVITPMLQKGVTVDMARAQNAHNMQDADKDDAVIIAITRDGQTISGQPQIDLEEITNDVKDLISDRLDKTVYIRSDSRAKYGDVVKAVDEVRSAGRRQSGSSYAEDPGQGSASAAVRARGNNKGVVRWECQLVVDKGAGSEPNIVPLIDVLLVLIIIFMVITPKTPTGLDALVPQPPPPKPEAAAGRQQDHCGASGAE